MGTHAILAQSKCFGDTPHNIIATILCYSDRTRLVASPPQQRLANSYMLKKQTPPCDVEELRNAVYLF